MRYWPSLFGQDGWILAKFFFCNPEQAKKERAQYPAILTEQAWSIKVLLYGQKVTPSISFNAPVNVSTCDFQNQA